MGVAGNMFEDKRNLPPTNYHQESPPPSPVSPGDQAECQACVPWLSLPLSSPLPKAVSGAPAFMWLSTPLCVLGHVLVTDA